MNNLKSVGLALHLYHERWGSLPPAVTCDANGRPLHSWRTLILPHVDQKHLYDSIDLSKPWNDPVNQKAFNTHVRAYGCPETKLPQNHTTYQVIVSEGGMFSTNTPLKFDDVTDGLGSTLMVIETSVKDSIPWMQPVDADRKLIHQMVHGKNLLHPGGFNTAFADGSVGFIRADLEDSLFDALISFAGGDDPGEW